MREYYCFLYPSYMLDKNRGNNEVRFIKKHCDIAYSPKFRYTAALGNVVKFIQGIYFYKENGRYYEFFSGFDMGCETTPEYYNGYYSIRIAYGIVVDTDDPDNDNWLRACKMSAEQFALEVKPHIKYRKAIAKMIVEFFSILGSPQNNRKQDRIREQYDSDVAWLEEYLDKRNNGE